MSQQFSNYTRKERANPRLGQPLGWRQEGGCSPASPQPFPFLAACHLPKHLLAAVAKETRLLQAAAPFIGYQHCSPGALPGSCDGHPRAVAVPPPFYSLTGGLRAAPRCTQGLNTAQHPPPVPPGSHSSHLRCVN